jgi:hypothetical protein
MLWEKWNLSSQISRFRNEVFKKHTNDTMGSAASTAAASKLSAADRPEMVMSPVDMIYEMTRLVGKFRSAYYRQLNPGPDVSAHDSACNECQLIAEQVHVLVNLPNAPANFEYFYKYRGSVAAMRSGLQNYYNAMLPIWRAEYDGRQQEQTAST